MGKYDDIIHMSRPASRRKPMSREMRAAQFAPFAALTGYGEQVKETARRTEGPVELDEDQLDVMDEQLSIIADRIRKAESVYTLEEMRAGAEPDYPEISVTYFVRDDYKEGGSYVTLKAGIRKIERFRRQLILTDGSEIPLDDVVEMEV